MRDNIVYIIISFLLMVATSLIAYVGLRDRETYIVYTDLNNTGYELNFEEVEVMESPRSIEIETVEATGSVEIIEEDPISEEDIDLLARLLYAEAGSDWIEDKTIYWVGSVVLNRVNSEHYPDTLYDVIYQEGQYSCTWLGGIYNEPTERCYRIAEDLLRNGSILPEDVLYQAEFKQGSEVYDESDNLYFCYY